ncbi:SUMO-activating enzyme subunit 2 [Drosophila pseudoobscura]|uniref:SUMO-activating enzyme subunit n=1 Tax=Drosophila pseudoobscura pseudoobscura TaxID=46245 RepID=A0A6I8UEP6_DROPS|nr:SUMO-activating enzyme subunit 2 [Drosophila pseudoobscura]
MAAAIDGVLPGTLQELVKKSKVLVVGAGGIGCEVLKNLVLSGFNDIQIIDLDTIDLSNLNRQFLFHREHVGKSKARVARETALSFNPDAKITAYHDSVTSSDYGVSFFQKFDVILSALDNRAARNHVNRMCLNADVPLIESGTSGYNGQVELIKRGLTQCYECTPKEKQRSFPGCTIRNTPSEPIHCIVWAKHLFNQLFGESLDDEDISPDAADPDAQSVPQEFDAGAGGDGEAKISKEKTPTEEGTNNGNVVRINTRQWAKDCDYDAAKLFNKFFDEDINYLLKMSNLWTSRKAPVPVSWDTLVPEGTTDIQPEFARQHHKVWTVEECAHVFANTLKELSASFLKLKADETLVWDKDDQPAMDFVAACANVRSYIFDIERKSRFEIKSMAGNIIPAIATTNAITAGISVMRAFNVLEAKWEQCKAVYARLRPNGRGQFLVPDASLAEPNPSCYVCSLDPAITLRIDTKRVHIKELRDDVLIKTLNMLHPDVVLVGSNSILISSEEGETTDNDDKLLSEMNVVDGAILNCDDFHQNYSLSVIISHFDAERDDSLFEVSADSKQLQPKEEEQKKPDDETDKGKEARKRSANGADVAADDGPSTSKRSRPTEIEDDDDDDCLVIEEENDEDVMVVATDNLSVESPAKSAAKRKPSVAIEDITEILDSSDEEEAGPTKCKRSKIELPDLKINQMEVINID